MSRYERIISGKHTQRGQSRRERKELNRSFSNMFKAWADLGVSMGTNSLRAVVEGMRATTEAIAEQLDADALSERTRRSAVLRGIPDISDTWAKLELAMGKTALEKSADGLKVTADPLDDSKEKRGEPSEQTTSDCTSNADAT